MCTCFSYCSRSHVASWTDSIESTVDVKLENQSLTKTDSPPPKAEYVPHVVIYKLPTLIQETAGVECTRFRISLRIMSDSPVQSS